MKKFGFTLAEVLITLAVIGVVAAITLPNLVTSYQYSTLGVKLSKFMSSTQAAARPFSVANEAINTDALMADFVDSSFDFKDHATFTTADLGAARIELKDGTFVTFSAASAENDSDFAQYPDRKYGTAAYIAAFEPTISGLPRTVQSTYRFTITDMGYVYPSPQDQCNEALFNNLNYKTKASDFRAGNAGAACVGAAAPETPETPEG